MKSPIPFLKPKSYYSPPSRLLVIRDEIVLQIDPIRPEHVIATSLTVEQIVIQEEEPTIGQPIEGKEQLIKYKKSKQKSTKSDS